MLIGGPRDKNDVLRAIEKRIVKNAGMLRRCRENGEELDVEYLRGCISELEIVRAIVEAMPAADQSRT